MAKEKELKATTVVEGDINTKILAGLCGTTPKALRRRLRAKWYNDGKHTDYAWKAGDKVLNEILASYNKGPMTGAPKGRKGGKKEKVADEVIAEAVSN